jgi:cation:H+ antiporter
MWLALIFVLGGFLALLWSSDLFVAGSSTVAKRLGISPFIIGMVIIGFGTSAPELCVSVMSSVSGHSNVSLGNAYGSCIFNIAAILGIAALIRPIFVKPAISFAAVPALLLSITLSYFFLKDGVCNRIESAVLLLLFAVLMPIYCWFDQKKGSDVCCCSSEDQCKADDTNIILSILKLLVGLAVLVGSSHVLVWGAVDLARAFGVSELMIGLTIVGIGTSLPELASAIASARRGEDEFVLGNIVGSNLFNTLGVVGLASVISPIKDYSKYIILRDIPIMIGLTLSIAIFGLNLKKIRQGGKINRFEGFLWVSVFVAYSVLLFFQERGTVD